MLIKNFFKDIYITLPRLISVILVTALGVFIFVSMNTVNTNLQDTARTYFAEQHVADYWVYGDKLTKADEKKLKAIPHVTDTQAQIVLQAEQARNSEVKVILHGVSGGFKLNTPLIVAGDMPKNNREIMLLEEHAKSHALQVGDKYDLIIPGTNEKLSFVICALMKAPEYVSIATNTEPIQNSYKVGVAYMQEGAISKFLGENNYNQLCFKVSPGTDDEWIRKQVKDSLGYKVSSLQMLEDKTSSYIIFNSIQYITVISTVLPWIFFLVAALIMFTTMTRVVENARMQIGTLKSQGYSDFTILMYYLMYSVIVTVVGVILGCLPMMLLVVPLYEVYRTVIIMPPHVITPDYTAILHATLLTAAFCMGTSFFICTKALKETPAECMRPKPPTLAKDLFLEKITFLWRMLSFSQKTVARNIFRNKVRMFMCIAGVCGCMAITVGAMSFLDSNTVFVDKRYKDLYNFDIQVAIERNTPENISKKIGEVKGVSKIEYQMDMPLSVYRGERKENGSLKIVDDTVSLMLMNSNGETTQALPKDGLIISRYVAATLGLSEGDEMQFTVGVDSKKHTAIVRGISDNKDINYTGRTFWRSQGLEFSPTTAYVQAKDIKATADLIDDYDFVETAKDRNEIIFSIEDTFSVASSFAFAFVTFAGMLALVVLYNLGILNFYERIRELATLMVLGFNEKEIKHLILKENTIFTYVGIIIGIPFGMALGGVLLGSALRFGYTVDLVIKPESYAFSVIIVLTFSFIVNLMLGRKFKQIDMIGALKSVE